MIGDKLTGPPLTRPWCCTRARVRRRSKPLPLSLGSGRTRFTARFLLSSRSPSSTTGSPSSSGASHSSPFARVASGRSMLPPVQIHPLSSPPPLLRPGPSSPSQGHRPRKGKGYDQHPYYPDDLFVPLAANPFRVLTLAVADQIVMNDRAFLSKFTYKWLVVDEAYVARSPPSNLLP